MASLKVKFKINKGRRGAPLTKLGKIAEQSERFLRSLASDHEIAVRDGEWLAANFRNGSVFFDAEFHGPLTAVDNEVFTRGLEFIVDFDPTQGGLNGLASEETALEYSKIGSLLDPDEEVGLGIYPPSGEGRIKWRSITYGRSLNIRTAMEAPLIAHGALQGIVHAWFKEASRPYIQVRELGTDALVKVHYRSALYSSIVKAVEERTAVITISGSVSYDRVKKCATEMKADRLEVERSISPREFDRFFGSAPDYPVDLDIDEEGALDG